MSYHYGSSGFTLLYLWFDCDTEEATEHRQEINDFRDVLKGEVDFRSTTYHELFQKIKCLPDVHNEYLEYLSKRYFQAVHR